MTACRLPIEAVAPGLAAMYAFSASPLAAVRCTVDTRCAWLMMVLTPPSTLAMTTPAAPAKVAGKLLVCDRGGNVPNLGFSAPAVISNLDKFVFNSPLKNNGMPDFTGKLKAEDVDKLKAFIQGTVDAVRPKP